MLLTIDIGNTNMVLGVFAGDTIVEHWRVATVPDRTADEIAALLHGLLARSSVVRESDLAGISLCSTVPSVLHEARRQLDQYFKRKLRRFDLPLAARGTPFQQGVWKMMRAIPFGETATYGGMAMALGSGPRAVGMACGRNPLPIVVPCHRVLASGGKEGGFSGGQGLPTKRKLLALEGVVLR